MQIYDAKAAKQSFGKMIDDSRLGPVLIRKHGRDVAVVLAAEEFAQIEALYDDYLVRKAKRTAHQGYLNVKDTARLLGEIRNGDADKPSGSKDLKKTPRKTRKTNR